MLTSLLPLSHQPMTAKRSQMLRYACRRQSERERYTGHILLTEPKLFDKPHAIRVGEHFEQIRHFFRHDDTAGNGSLLCKYAKL